MKFLKAVRLDVSDSHLYATEGAAEDGEWLVSGGYAVCNLASGQHFRPNCYCDISFIGLATFGRCTIAEVVEIDETNYHQHIQTLTRYFLDNLGAPSEEAARALAEEEVAYTADLCESFNPEVWITVKRTPKQDGEGFDEHYSVFKRLMIGAHKL
jgi:hypothetical protein